MDNNQSKTSAENSKFKTHLGSKVTFKKDIQNQDFSLFKF